MIFILDYENCHYAGMCGVEYLEPTDRVEIFFSPVCNRVKSGDWNAIKRSGCKISTYSLQQPGKQALDMAICTRVGEIIGSATKEEIAIISGDQGYKATRDYCMRIHKRRVILEKSIRQAIAQEKTSIRKNNILAQEKLLSLSDEYDCYTEYLRMYEKCEKIFAGTEMEDRVAEIVDLLLDKSGPKMLYLNSLKRFGRKSGTETYRELKKMLA